MPLFSAYTPQSIGDLREITVTSPGAGANWSHALTHPVYTSTTFKVRVAAVHFKLTTSVAVALRVVTFNLPLGGINMPISFTNTIPASQIKTFSLYIGAARADSEAQNAFVDALPEFLTSSAYSLSTTTAAIQGADQYSEIRLMLEYFVS